MVIVQEEKPRFRNKTCSTWELALEAKFIKQQQTKALSCSLFSLFILPYMNNTMANGLAIKCKNIFDFCLLHGLGCK